MNNELLNAFWQAADAKLSPSPENLKKLDFPKPPTNYGCDPNEFQEWCENTKNAFITLAECRASLRELEADLSNPAALSDCAEKLEVINQRLEILDLTADAPRDANGSVAATMRAFRLEAIRKKVEGENDTVPDYESKTLG